MPLLDAFFGLPSDHGGSLLQYVSAAGLVPGMPMAVAVAAWHVVVAEEELEHRGPPYLLYHAVIFSGSVCKCLSWQFLIFICPYNLWAWLRAGACMAA